MYMYHCKANDLTRRKPNLFHVKPEQEILLQLISAGGKNPETNKSASPNVSYGSEWKALFNFLE